MPALDNRPIFLSKTTHFSTIGLLRSTITNRILKTDLNSLECLLVIGQVNFLNLIWNIGTPIKMTFSL